MKLFTRLYRGELEADFIGTRRRWYAISVVIIAICLASMAFKGFNFGIEFSGGNSFTMSRPDGSSLSDAREAVESAGVEVQTAQEAGSGGQKKFVIKTEELSTEESAKVKKALSDRLDIPESGVNDSAVSSSWGSQITEKGLIALGVFLLLVTAYIWIWFEQKMAMAALGALIHDLVLTAGVYSLVGFEVTPSTVIGLLTILGFSLYDTVVVFDKVKENTKGLLSGPPTQTYGEAANLAVNQTIMRSINTTVISLLPVGGLLFVGAGLLGVGTLKDLALVLFVGLMAGMYSSLFLATPWLVDLKEREPRYKTLTKKVLERRSTSVAAAREAANIAPGSDDDESSDGEDGGLAARSGSTASSRRKGKHGRPTSTKRGR